MFIDICKLYSLNLSLKYIDWLIQDNPRSILAHFIKLSFGRIKRLLINIIFLKEIIIIECSRYLKRWFCHIKFWKWQISKYLLTLMRLYLNFKFIWHSASHFNIFNIKNSYPVFRFNFKLPVRSSFRTVTRRSTKGLNP